MDIYHGWFNLKDGVRDADFAERVRAYMEHLRGQGLIAGWRLTRRKLGLAPPFLREFHIMIETDGMAQLDAAFALVSERAEPVEGLHHAVNSAVQDLVFALYRDFPDSGRKLGEERF
jgi:hypothetical protein